ncbi:DUF2142 domain-containing protein [Lactococcus formosensis]|jgi:uncharacterized membrane protein|uniref:DUF2142 domain-containing protein n=1 Tax=Lactococcus formosensis TaxID=1281486 RepID=UPI001F062EA2|nr:DUF2142 domain-containing protein [Lactococcus formosensis]MCH1722639.1 DUF2142 domain-containing protein [Lactococcus formosensis]
MKRIEIDRFEKNLHKIYFTVAVIIGVVLSIGMPLFSEPDGQWHYSVSSNIAGLSNDLSAYGEPVGTGTGVQKSAYQQENWFEKYFENQIVRMPIENIPRTNSVPPVLNFNFLGHAIPAFGVWLGYHIYPSIGVMIVVGRLVSSLIASFVICMIIKYVKRAKLLFMALSLTPVIATTTASLSYDTLSYIGALLVFLVTINVYEAKRLNWKYMLAMLATTVLVMLGTKTNIKILVALFPIVIFVLFLQHRKELGKADFINLKDKKQVILSAGILGLAVLAVVVVLVLKPSLLFSAYRLVINFTVNLAPGLSTNNIFLGLLASPYPGYNYMPYWVAGAWYILILLVMLVEEKFVTSKLLSLGALGIFIANFLGVYHGFLTFLSGGYNPAPNTVVVGSIYGQQGRYFTPFIPLLALGLANPSIKLSVLSKQSVLYLTVGLAFVSNFILVFATLFGINYL